MARLLYICHDIAAPRGGISVLYDHVATLRQHGFDAWIVHGKQGFRYPHGPTEVPVIDASSGLAVNADDFIVVPEDHHAAIHAFGRAACRKALFCQNHYYIFHGLNPGEHWRDFGFTDYLCVSEPIAAAMQEYFGVTATTVRPALDDVYFGEAPAGAQAPVKLACMPRKGGPHLRHLAGLLPRLTGAAPSWVPIDGLTRPQVAERLRQSDIYISTSVDEGLGLPPLEAMAAGCLVIGYAGGGGLDYARPDNGIWVADQDVWALARAVAGALADLQDPVRAAPLLAKRRAGQETARCYSRQAFTEALLGFWRTRLDDKAAAP
jgi:hypothetical protein